MLDDINELTRAARKHPAWEARPARRGQSLRDGFGRKDHAILCGWRPCPGRLGTIVAIQARVEWVLPHGYHRAADGMLRPTRHFLRRSPDHTEGQSNRRMVTSKEFQQGVIRYWTGPWPVIVECPRCGRPSEIVRDILTD